LVSVLCFCFDGSLSKVIALLTIAIAIVVALKGKAKRLPLLFANTFKSIKEQQLMLLQLLEER
jgi:hypothetical protein